MDLPRANEPSPPARGALDQACLIAARMLAAGVRDKVFLGASPDIGWRGERAFVQGGKLMYTADSAAVGSDTLFDCASLTKVVATTTMAMMLVDRGLLALD